VVNGHKSAADTDSPNGDSGKTCLGGGMHCPSASSSSYDCKLGPMTFELDIGMVST